MSTLQLQTDPKVAGAWCHISYDVPPTVDDANNVDGDWDERATNKEGYTAFLIVAPKHTFVLVRAPGYQDALVDVQMPHDELITVPLTAGGATSGPLTRLRAQGVDLVDGTGRRFFAKGCTDFLLYKRFLDGENIQPILNERQSLGCNCVRVFGMVASFSHWFPQEYGDRYYDQIQAFCDLCASFHLYVYFTVFADTQVVMPGRSTQEAHWNRVVDQLRRSENTVVEVGNELDQHGNRIDFSPSQPGGILACCGSLGGDVPCALPAWALSDFHARRDYPSAVKDMCVLELREGWSTYAGTHGPIWHGEPQGFGPNPKRWQDPVRARELAGTARGTAAGVFFHSDNGVQSQLFDGVTHSCAVAFFDELRGL